MSVSSVCGSAGNFLVTIAIDNMVLFYQTWPTEAKMAEADKNQKQKRLRKRTLPRGTSEYHVCMNSCPYPMFGSPCFNYISSTSLFSRYVLHVNLLVVDSQALFIYHRLLGLWMIQMRRI